MRFLAIIVCGVLSTITAFGQNSPIGKNWSSPISEFSDKQYPANPDIGFRSPEYGLLSFAKMTVSEKDALFDVSILAASRKEDDIILKGLNLLEWMPSIPLHLRGDEYLSLVSVVNQEFNRQQVKIPMDKVSFQGKGMAHTKVTRVDLARNCLMSYLWEVILFTNEDGVELPIYHGWFNFPRELYAKLFQARNGCDFERYATYLETWKDLESREIDVTKLRTVVKEQKMQFTNLNNQLYELKGERKKKARNIVYPSSPSSIDDLVTDSAKFATFSPPGVYDVGNPKTTRLGLFKEPKSLAVRQVSCGSNPNKNFLEIDVTYQKGPDSTVHLVTGGVEFGEIPHLALAEAHKGYQNSMGFGNHSFFEDYEYAVAHSSLQSPFYSFLSDQEGKWLDSHIIGIDGILLHFDLEHPTHLHIWVLSFERHSFVGHLVTDIAPFL